MQQNKFVSFFRLYGFRILAAVVIFFGIAMRVTMFVQNRNLIIDEANVVRNVWERGFFGLLKPLSYEQYAPPAYLWNLELFSHIFGYSEYAMRLPALLWGIAAIFAFYALARKVMPEYAAWFPLGLLAFAPIFIKYSAEVKQYGPDAFVAIMLVLLALRTDINTYPRKRFFWVWALAGSIAVWSSQPSVFILAAVGIYYFAAAVAEKKWNAWKVLLPIALIWFAQFGLYYMLILKAQINSDYLQNYHREYFLFAYPDNAAEWKHNWVRIREILNNTVGYSQRSFYLCIPFIIMGIVALWRRSVPLFLLLTLPIGLTLLAAALKQFSLIERVALFMLPFTMLLTGLGFAQLWRLRFSAWRTLVVLVGMHMLWEYNFRQIFFEKFNFQELTVGMDYLLQRGASGKELFVDYASKDTYVYYTEVHPRRAKYAALKGARLLKWDDNYGPIAAAYAAPRSFWIFTGGGEGERNKRMGDVEQVLGPPKTFSFVYCYVYEFVNLKK